MLRPTRQNCRDPNFFFAISDFLFFFSGFPRTPIVRRKQTSKASSDFHYNQCTPRFKRHVVNSNQSKHVYQMHFLIPVTLTVDINISRGNVKHVVDLTCAQNIGSLSFTPCHMYCGRSVKKLIATLLRCLTCHPMREQKCLGGKIFRAG